MLAGAFNGLKYVSSLPPAAFGPDLPRRSIAQRVQEQHYGGFSASVERQLNQIVKDMAKKPNGRIELPKRIKSGAILVRTWKDNSHRVMVLDDGFCLRRTLLHQPLGNRARNDGHPMECWRWKNPCLRTLIRKLHFAYQLLWSGILSF
jgi:hypothetical protein